MSIYSYLKQDHEEVKELMNRIASLGDEDQPKKVELFNTLKENLIIHAKAEEAAFYEPLEDKRKTHDEIEHAKKEHQEAESLLEELTDESLKGAAWQQKFQKLKASVEHHIKEEEGEIFKDAKTVLNSEDARKMEEDMKERKNAEGANRDINKLKPH